MLPSAVSPRGRGAQSCPSPLDAPLTSLNSHTSTHTHPPPFRQIENLDSVSGTLEELWISYNQITSLDGIAQCSNLTTLYISNNGIKAWNELDKLASLVNLRDVLLMGNPIYDEFPTVEARRVEVLKRLPNLAKIDGDMVKPNERELATGIPSV